MVKYVSTRGRAPELEFEDALLTGLARDGGLYVPAEWPHWSKDEIAGLAGLSYEETAFRVMRPYIGASIADADLRAMIEGAYSGFRHEAVVPLRQMAANDWLLELFHGPTLAFKDVAMQILARLFDHVLAAKGRRITVVGATSGDTGSAAIEAFRGRDTTDIFILHPKGRVSEVQRRQMTTVLDANVHNIAVEGSFDDCQALVKAMFNGLLLGADGQFRRYFRRVRRREDGPSGGQARHRDQCERHPGAHARDGTLRSRPGRADDQPEHGHPGFVQFRAPAFRRLRE